METTIEFEKELFLGAARKYRAVSIDEAHKFARAFGGTYYYCFGWIVVI